MAYATIEDIIARKGALDAETISIATALLDDVAVLIDSYNKDASDEAKKIVSCRVVIRAIGDTSGAPIGATQGSMGALGYTQSWTISNGTTGEIYLNRTDKKLLGVNGNIGSYSPVEGLVNS